MQQLWEAYVFWMGIYGPQIITGMFFGMSYWATKRIAIAMCERRLRKYPIP